MSDFQLTIDLMLEEERVGGKRNLKIGNKGAEYEE
jgi:hypothetical protein